MAALREALAQTRARKAQAQQRRSQIAQKLQSARQIRDTISDRINALTYEQTTLLDQKQAMEDESLRVSIKLKKSLQLNVLNDAFYIWYIGQFATINGFKLGNLPAIKPVEWQEINAALGQAVLAVHIVAQKAKFQFVKYTLSPMGSFPKIYRAEDKRSPLSLFSDGSFNLFPKRSFNNALTGFLTCVQELGEFTKNRDPTLALPYAINVADSMIHDQCISLGTDEETWTRALKYLLTDIKWLIAWASKHCHNNPLLKHSSTSSSSPTSASMSSSSMSGRTLN